MLKTPNDDDDAIEIREVWNHNLDSEFDVIRSIVDEFPYVAMDTEFPGIVIRPLAPFSTQSERNYQTLKANVDLLKLIQLGLTFSDHSGRRRLTFQFNFNGFDPQTDVFASDSVELLRQSGIDFNRNSIDGVDSERFAELLMSSGVVLNDQIQWITFHSGYDFGYLIKILTCRGLPESIDGFFDLIDAYFPVVYDMKHLMKYCNSLHGGLSKLAELLDVKRVGISHQAGSDSLLTADAFRKLIEVYFGGDVEKYAGVLFGLETSQSIQ